VKIPKRVFPFLIISLFVAGVLCAKKTGLWKGRFRVLPTTMQPASPVNEPGLGGFPM